MSVFRLKHTFSSGELSPLLGARLDFDRYKNGCKALFNMFCTAQGPAVRRPGLAFSYDLTTLGLDAARPEVRLIPFIFNEDQAYVMVFFNHQDGSPRLVFAATESDGSHGLVLGEGIDEPCITEYQDYIGVGDYEYTIGIQTPSELLVWHVAADATRTNLTYLADYTVVVGSPNIVTVTNAALPEDGVIYIALAGISTAEVVAVTLPDTLDIAKFDWAQSADEMYIAESGIRPHIIKRFGHSCWQLVESYFVDEPPDWPQPIEPTDPPEDWTYTEDELAKGWPERVTFHQQRLAYAANLIRRQTVWLTKAGDFTSFERSNPLVDDDGVTFTLDSGTQNRIQWMVSGKTLGIGTLGNEWTVAGNTIPSLTPENVWAQRQTNNGSEPNKPLLIGLSTLFIELHGRTVNEFVYDYSYDSYRTTDMAILSPHLTEAYSIVDWTYQQTPGGIVWCVRADGVMLGITYQRQHKVVGWHRHATDGQFRAVTSIPGKSREDDVWVVVQRNISGQVKFYLEKLSDWFASEEAIDGRFLDSFLVYEGPPANTIGGLEHLEGKAVSALVNGAVHPDVVVEAGRINLEASYTHIVVGLPYTSEVRPFLTDIPNSDGTAFGKTQRITHLTIDFYRSLGVFFGRYDIEDGEVEEEIPFRIPGDLTGQAVPLFTGKYRVTFLEGFDREAEYFIRQKQPLPLTVRGIVDTVEAFK